MSAPPTQKSPPKWVYWLSGQPLFNGLAKAYRWLRSILENIPAFSALDRIAKAVTGKVYRIVRLPSNLEARVDPLLEIEAGRQMDPILAAALFAFFAGLGLYPSSLGHMDTTPYLFSVLPFVGVFNPYLGLCSGVVFAVFDWAGKWLYPLLSSLGSWVPVESVYGGNWSDGAQNFFGARAGYLFGYSIVLLTPLLPGILARVFRIVIHRLARQVLQRPTAAAAAGLLLLGGSAFAVTRLAGSEGALLLAVFPIILLAGSTASMSYGAGFVESVARALGTAGSVVGGMLGGGLSNSYARGPGNYMAFEAVRADPDLSCRALSAGNYMAHRPVTMATAAGGGFFPAGSAGALNPLVTQMTAMGGPMVFPGAIGGTNAPPAKPAGTAPDDPLEGEAKTSLRPEPLTPTPAPGTPDPAEGKPEQQSEWGHCMNCGMSLDNPKEPCPFCGGAWVKATDPRTTDPRNPLKGKICPVCGLSLPHFSTSCPACARTAKPPVGTPVPSVQPPEPRPPDSPTTRPPGTQTTSPPGGQSPPGAPSGVQPPMQPPPGGPAPPHTGGTQAPPGTPAGGQQSAPPPPGTSTTLPPGTLPAPPNQIVLSGPDAAAWLKANNLWTGNGPSPGFLNSSKLYGGGHDPDDGRLAIVVDDNTPGVPPPPPTVMPSGQDPGPYYKPPKGKGPAPPPTPATPPPSSGPGTGAAGTPGGGGAATPGQTVPPTPPQQTGTGGGGQATDGISDAADGALTFMENLMGGAMGTIAGGIDAATPQPVKDAIQAKAKAVAKEGIDKLVDVEVGRKAYLNDKGGFFADRAVKKACEKTGLSKEVVEQLFEMDQEEFDGYVKMIRSGLEKMAGGPEGGSGG